MSEQAIFDKLNDAEEHLGDARRSLLSDYRPGHRARHLLDAKRSAEIAQREVSRLINELADEIAAEQPKPAVRWMFCESVYGPDSYSIENALAAHNGEQL